MNTTSPASDTLPPATLPRQARRTLVEVLTHASAPRCSLPRHRLRGFVRRFLKLGRKDATLLQRCLRSGTKAGALCGLLLGLLPAAHAVVPVLTQVSGACNAFTGIDVGSAAVPRVVDIDGDGDLDVFIGVLDGTIHYYTNTGTNISPTLVAQVGAANPLNGIDIGSYAAPAFVDIDGDGDLDVFIGANGAGAVRFFRNGGTASSPSFTEVVGAGNPFDGVAIPFGVPAFVDIDNDGDRDAFIGGQDGAIRFFRNTGSAAAPVMSAVVGAADPFNGIDLGSYAAPAFVDLDGDGDLDALLGSQAGTVRYFDNTGTTAAPVFAEVVGAGNPFNGFDVGNASTPAFADLDGDGDQDAFVGNFTGTIDAFRAGPAAPILTAGNQVAGTHTEGGAGVAPFGTAGITDIEISDCDSATLNGATITLANGQPGDLLSFTNQNGITGSFAAGVLTLSGSASLANYQTALRSVLFSSSSDDPTVGGTANVRAIYGVVTDNTGLNSNTRNHGVVISGVNDGPSATAPATIVVVPNTASALTGISFADPDAGSNSVTATLSVTSGTLNGVNGGGVTVSGSGTATLTLAGARADINAFIAAGSAQFTTAPGATANVALTIGINDGGNTGGGALTGSASATIVVGPRVTGTKTVSGTFLAGTNVTYTVTLANSGNAQGDNAGNEFTDVLPAGLSLVSASATSGTAVATIGTNTVTWNGAIATSGSVTLTLTATINGGASGTISNQGSISYDADANGTNEASAITDDPGVAGAANPTSFTVAVPAAVISGTKTVSGTLAVGGTIVYTVVLSNSGGPQGDFPGNEFTDVLPAGLSLVSASATSGTAVATIGTNTVTWNGSIPAAGSVTISLAATVNAGASGTISNQGSISYDGDGNGSNEASAVTDDPGVAGAGNPTSFTLDTTPPAAPSTPDLAVASDSGSSAIDNITSDTTPTFTGSAEAGSTVRLFAGATEVGSVTAAGGTWSITASALASASYSFTATATDGSNNVSVASAGLNVTIDDAQPTIGSITPPANATYLLGENLDFTVNTNENVLVDMGGGTPNIALTIGATARTATYQSGSGSSALLFRYVVQNGDLDMDGVQLTSPVVLNGSTLRDVAGNNVVPAFVAPNTTGVLVDAVPLTIASVTPPANGSYRAGQMLDFTVGFSANATVDTTGGTPAIPLTVGATARSASYVSGSGTASLVFRYTVPAGDTDADGIVAASPMVLNGGTIRSATSQNAVLTFTVPNTSAVLVDTTAPVAPVFTSIATDSGVFASDNITNDTTLVLNGTAEPNSTVTVSRTSIGVLGTATASGAGAWSFDYTGTTLGAGDHAFTATAADIAGNVGPASGAFIVTVDTEVNAPVITAIGTDTGSSATDGITSDATLTVFGTAEAGSTVTVSRSGVGELGTATASVGGLWSFDYSGTTLAAGSYLFSATTTDISGNTSAASADFAVTIDTAAPVAPVFTAVSTDTGSSSSDRITNDTTLAFNGTAEPGTTVTLTRVGTGTIGTATADGAGAWSFDYTGTTLGQGVHSFTATATDTAGNTGAASAAFEITVDTTAPAFTSATSASGPYRSAFPTFTVTAPGAATFAASGLPAGLTIDAATGAITGTATQAGLFNATLTATDLAGNAATGPLAVTITPAPLTVAGLVVNDKSFDGNTSASVNTTGASLVGILGGDTVTLNTAGLTATFSDPNAGLSKTVTVSGLTLGGAHAANYTLTQPVLSGNIVAAGQVVFLSASGPIDIGVPLTINATASSGLPVSLSVVSGPGSLSGNQLTVTAHSPVTIRGVQAGGTNYAPASAELTLSSFRLQAQTIAFAPPTGLRVGNAVTLQASATSGLPVQFALVSGNATLEGAVLTPRDASPIVIRATQAGGDGFFAAPPVEVTVRDIAKREQTIAFAQLADRKVNAPPFGLAASASSGLPVTLTLVSGPATLSGATLTLAGSPGTVTLRAVQAGDATYAEAPAVERTFTVTPLIAGRFVNLSARARAGAGAQTFIAGFTVGGGVSKQLLVRAVGPGLAAFGLTGVLADPILQISRDGRILAENSNWAGDAAVAAAAARVGAFALNPASPDAALLATLNTGPYTTLVSGGTGAGVVLTEIYAADPVVSAADQHFINFSVRAESGPGDAAMIVGFVVNGETPANILIRAIGPGLAPFGLSPLLADPRVQLFRGTAEIAANEDLSAGAAEAAARVGAFALPPGSRDAAIVFTVAPGAYTIVLRGADATPGIALLEVYELP